MMNHLPSDDLAFRQWLSDRLDPFKSVDPNDPLYVQPTQDPARDPITLTFNSICDARQGSLSFISGFIGSGKTSELRRLKNLLAAEGLFVAMADASDYFLPTEPVTIDILLIALAGAYSDEIEKLEGIDPAHQSYWQRLVTWLERTSLSLEGFDLNAGLSAGTPQSVKAELGMKFKLLLKENPAFISKLQAHMAARPQLLRKEVHAFFADASRLIEEKYRTTLRPVFIFDSFEKLHDLSYTEGRVSQSISSILSNHQHDLRIPGHHVVMTMPPWIKLMPQGPSNLRLIYGVKLWKNTPERTASPEGLKLMRQIVEKRFTPTGLDRFFGKAPKNGTRPLVDALIRASGGHLRDLMLLLRDTLARAPRRRDSPDQPFVARSHITAAISNHRNSFDGISDDEITLLLGISQSRKCHYPSGGQSVRNTMHSLLNGRFAFILPNDHDWCDVHPLLRDLTVPSSTQPATQAIP